MATKLSRKVKRELTRVQATKKGRITGKNEIGRPVIVELLPEEIIQFRVKGTKTKYQVHLVSVFSFAQRKTYEALYREKMEIYRMKKKAGFKHLKKPKQIYLPFKY